jgi:hypothetical protein
LSCVEITNNRFTIPAANAPLTTFQIFSPPQ